jgi:hypothetical protein
MDAQRTPQLRGGLRPLRKMVGKSEPGCRIRYSRDPTSGRHLDELDVRRQGL